MLQISKNEVQFVTQKELAEYLGVSPQFVNMVFKGRRPMPDKHRRSLSKKFRIPENFWDSRIAA